MRLEEGERFRCAEKGSVKTGIEFEIFNPHSAIDNVAAVQFNTSLVLGGEGSGNSKEDPWNELR
jgi:hypothetical protein